MHKHTLFIFAAGALALGACSDDGTDPTGPTGTVTGTTTGTAGTTTGTAGTTTGTPMLMFTVDWFEGYTTTTSGATGTGTSDSCNDSMTLTITGDDGITWANFGMAQTDPAYAPEWTGEDCLDGYQGLQFCHPLMGSSLSLDEECDVNALVAGSTTLFESGISGSITYMAEADDGSCYAWGDNPGYYMDCTDVSM